MGMEIKLICDGNVNLCDVYCVFKDGELFVYSMFIVLYLYGNQFNYEVCCMCKLLLKCNELKKLEKKVKEKGFIIVLYKLYISDRGFVKVEIVLVQGKKSYDKCESIK